MRRSTRSMYRPHKRSLANARPARRIKGSKPTGAEVDRKATLSARSGGAVIFVTLTAGDMGAVFSLLMRKDLRPAEDNLLARMGRALVCRPDPQPHRHD